jgi:2-polyprenyl-3-methyl-5-hydroxy-6-metoxy-1,4-benzoquinol methylase
MTLDRIAALMGQTWRNSQAGIEPLNTAVARRLRLMPFLLKRAAISAAVSVLPDSLLPLGAYRHDAVLPQDWENEYSSGRWSYMKGVHELARYSVIVGYYGFFRPGGTILDVGCGEGILQQKLAPLGYHRYLGIDVSANAITKAGIHGDSRTEFRHTDIESFVPDQKFDTIIFNEVLYYFPDPVDIVRRLADSLAPGGIMIASIWTSPCARRRSLQIWRLLDSIVEIIHSTTAASREIWTIKVLRPKPGFARGQKHPAVWAADHGNRMTNGLPPRAAEAVRDPSQAGREAR